MNEYEISEIETEVLGSDVLGDSSTTLLATGALAEALKMGGQMGAQSQEKKELAAKDKKTKAEADEAARKLNALTEQAQKLRTEATIAQQLAQSEANPSGPLHLAYIRADAAARQAEGKLGYGLQQNGQFGMQQSSGPNFLTKRVGGLPVYGWGLIGVGAITATILVVKAMR